MNRFAPARSSEKVVVVAVWDGQPAVRMDSRHTAQCVCAMGLAGAGDIVAVTLERDPMLVAFLLEDLLDLQLVEFRR